TGAHSCPGSDTPSGWPATTRPRLLRNQARLLLSLLLTGGTGRRHSPLRWCWRRWGLRCRFWFLLFRFLFIGGGFLEHVLSDLFRSSRFSLGWRRGRRNFRPGCDGRFVRSEEHTSELQSREK